MYIFVENLKPEEIEILYEPNVLVCLDGANLYHYLRAARKYAANSKLEREKVKKFDNYLHIMC